MPQLGETVTEGTVTKWLKSVGEKVERDEPLFEVSTDKVDSEVPSPASGVLQQIMVPEGETVDVGTVVALVSDGSAPGASSPAPPALGASSPAPAAAQPEAVAEQVEVPPVDTTVAAPTPSPSAPQSPPSAPAARTTESVGGSGGMANRILSPVVRKLLDENGVDPAEVKGTGLGGRITRADVLGVIDARRARGVPAVTGSPTAAAASAAPSAASGKPGSVAPTPSSATRSAEPSGWAGTDEIVPFTNIRRRTAEHMVRSKATSAHTLVVVEADYENVEKVRRAYGAAFKAEEGFSLTYLPFVARATVEALREWPELNASVGEDSLILHHSINLGVAVDLDHRGLIVPVVHRAEEFTLRGIARRIRDLADRARSKKLSADDISAGTFSITNAGPFGTFLTGPIINQPQVGIVSTDGVRRRPTVVTTEEGTEAIAIHSMGMLCLSWDHRAVDGAYAASFVARVAELLITHDWAAEL
ncbi:MAG TPA: dihydrolipoamide acetyltransferase family protein [Acidimicrobiales bacterium]|nr:dihydrolipoamide acetyltransferase family protein [Acidimicrobiales bacterium]